MVSVGLGNEPTVIDKLFLYINLLENFLNFLCFFVKCIWW